MSYLYAAFMSVPGFPFTPIKVGFTTNPIARTNDYRHGPFPITMIGFWEGTKEDEKNFHREFKTDRINGEWFIPASCFLEPPPSVLPSGMRCYRAVLNRMRVK